MKKPAIAGGVPVRQDLLPYARQWIDEDDVQMVARILRGDYLTTGSTLQDFEQAIAAYVGSTYAVAFSSGTAALHGAVFAAGIQPGDEVITTPLTFVASSNCVLYQGGKPIFADVHSDTYTIDPEEIVKNITPRTKAIIPVDYTGQPASLEAILSVARTHGLVVIEDAAHALGATYKGQRIGSISDMTMFSFHPVKHITTGEGGVITTNDKAYYERLLLFRSHGITRDEAQLTQYDGPWYYEMHALGYNYRLTDVQAALGLSQLKKLESFIERRKQIVSLYNHAFRERDDLILPTQRPHGESSWHLYVLRLRLERLTATRREIFEALLKENIGVNVHYIPVYYHPYYQKLGYTKGLCPRAEAIYESIITLPLFPQMNDEDVQDVIEAVHKVLDYYKK